jgi:hypothetical protein
MEVTMSIWLEDDLWCRRCPLCAEVVKTKVKGNAKAADQGARKCKTCASKPENNPRYGKPGTMSGKRHSESALSKLRALDKSHLKCEQFRKKMRQVWDEHHAGKPRLSNYEYILLRDGLAAAEEFKLKDSKRKSDLAKGQNNPMYGKPSPMGSGYGWKGWLDGRFFRSLRELRFMLDNPSAITAESAFWTAEFIFNGSERTTRPDFLLETEKIIVECKPERLHLTPQVAAKQKALSMLAESRGYSYVLTDPGIVFSAELQDLISAGRVTLTDKTKEIYKKWQS